LTGGGRSTGSELRRYLLATRPYSLLNSVARAVVGGVMAMSYYAGFRPLPIALTALVALGVAAFQASENVLNDYYDVKKGVDAPGAPATLHRLHSVYGLGLSLRQVRDLGISLLAFGVALVIIATVALNRPLLPLILAAGALLLISYTGPGGLKYRGLGELDVFVTAILMVVGSAYTVSGRLSWWEAALSVPMALLTASVVLADNLRDYEWDKAHGVRTLPVRVGKDMGKAMYAAMVLLALALPPVMLWPWGLLVEASLPLALLSILHVAEVYNLGLRRAVRFRFYVTIIFASLYAASIALAH